MASPFAQVRLAAMFSSAEAGLTAFESVCYGLMSYGVMGASQLDEAGLPTTWDRHFLSCLHVC